MICEVTIRCETDRVQCDVIAVLRNTDLKRRETE
jgi:hypothetical protein